MAEINPYESPKTSPSKGVAATAKKGMAFITLAILTPIAVFIAGFIGCLAVVPTITAVAGDRGINDPKFPFILMSVAGLAVFLVPPITVLAVMGRWAIRAYNREVEEHNAKLKRSKLRE